MTSEDLLWPSNWIIWPLIPSRWYISQNIPEIQTSPLLHPSDFASMSHWLPRRQARSLVKRFTNLLISICKIAIILLHLLVAWVKLRLAIAIFAGTITRRRHRSCSDLISPPRSGQSRGQLFDQPTPFLVVHLLYWFLSSSSLPSPLFSLVPWQI